MKRILLFILIIVGTGCKVTQQPVNKPEQQPDSHTVLKPDSVPFAQKFEPDSVARNLRSNPEQPDSVIEKDYVDGSNLNQSDTIPLESDAPQINPDSLAVAGHDGVILSADSLSTGSMPKKKGALEATVEYQAEDSIVWTSGNMAYLYNEADVKYQNIELKSALMRMDMDSSLLHATFSADSLGDEFGFPVFTEGDQNLETREMDYNFKTRKGSAKDLVTQQGEGFVTAAIAKKHENDAIHMLNGIYTTCDDHEHPHFFIRMTKSITRPGKDIVTGPAYLVVEDVPLFPLVLPFAFFPFTESYSSGILMPTYGDEMARGFFLRNGGYYFAASDFFDLSLTGEIYTKGSWGLQGQTSYKKRYKYSGRMEASYLTTVMGDKGLDDYTKTKDFKVRWSHSQDPHANPFRTLSASIDYSTSSYDRNQLNSLYTSAATQNNKGSSVSVTQKIPNKPLSISATMNINQRSQDSTVSVTLPDMNISLSRIYPFKRKSAIGKEHWYEKISMSYTGQLRNNITSKENEILEKSLVKDWKNGMQHRIPVSATYSLFDFINVSPSVDYTERWYTNKVLKGYDPDMRRLVETDTVYGFYRLYNYSAAVSASTTVYGLFTPAKFLQKIFTRVRHRMDMSVSFGANPDFSDPKYGYYHHYTYVDETGIGLGGNPTVMTGSYSPYSNGIFGVPSGGKSGSISFSVDNNIEAKVPDEDEPSGESKISIIDKLSGNMSYNLMADSLNWTDLNTSVRLKLSRSYTLNLNMVFDTYTYNKSGQKINKPRWTVGKGLGRLRSTGTSFSYTLNNDWFKKLFGDGENGKKNRNNSSNSDNSDDTEDNDPNEFGDMNDRNNNDINNPSGKEKGGSLLSKKKQSSGDYDYDGYYNVSIPWSLSFSYSLSLGYGTFNPDKLEYDYKLTHALSFNGNIQPTKNWRVSFNATYDADNRKISYMTCSISRTMHCFQMSASIIPIGPLKSYSFSISASSSMLKDLKYDQSSTPYNGESWY
ncbi:MAG: LPS-assembly protein LptD [Tannerella sp.]|nr:LPS-assembly protein LptD [Tannerella sp.]